MVTFNETMPEEQPEIILGNAQNLEQVEREISVLSSTEIAKLILKERSARRDAEVAELIALKSAETDSLMGILTKNAFMNRGISYLSHARRAQEPFAVVYMDAIDFKKINDTHGHIAGDEVLKEVGLRLKVAIRESDFAGRLGGDEAGAVLVDCNEENLEKIKTRLIGSLSDMIIHLPKGKLIRTGVTIGIVSWRGEERFDEVLDKADKAMYYEKSRSRNG